MTPTPPPIWQHIEALAARQTFADTCNAVAERFRAMAQDAYLDSDDARGDRLWTQQLRWEYRARTGRLIDE